MVFTSDCRFRHSVLVALALLSTYVMSILSAQSLPASYDSVIVNGRIVDGSGNGWFYGDLAIQGDRIVKIARPGQLDGAPTRERLDARGLVVAPGFIDIQSHSRAAFLVGDGRVLSKVTQGITTEIMGEASTDAPGTRFNGPRGFNDWLEAMQSHGVSPNIGSFLGATTVRAYVKGMAQGRATAEELARMREIVVNAMKDGAFGLGSALIYPPGNYADTEELIELAKAMAPFGGVYITHMRSEADTFIKAIDEAIEIGEKGGVPVEIFHLKAGGLRNWHKAQLAIARINAAREEGIDVQANMYPYIAGGTGLTACFPPSASADDKLFDNLADPQMRMEMKSEILRQTSEWENLCSLSTPEGVLILGLTKEENRRYIGKRLSEIAADSGKDWIDAAFDLVLSERQRVGTIYFMMTEENVERQLREPWIKFGTDAGGTDPETARGLVHPRTYGTYPRILGRYVRDRRVIPLEDAIRKMSSAVATRLQIRNRGLLKEGFFADVVVFDPLTIEDRATYENPHQLSVGMMYVMVNGTMVVRDGKHTGAKPGRIVRGPGYTGPE